MDESKGNGLYYNNLEKVEEFCKYELSYLREINSGLNNKLITLISVSITFTGLIVAAISFIFDLEIIQNYSYGILTSLVGIIITSGVLFVTFISLFFIGLSPICSKSSITNIEGYVELLKSGKKKVLEQNIIELKLAQKKSIKQNKNKSIIIMIALPIMILYFVCLLTAIIILAVA